jgi:N-sulfoglucosamine sulfohydrolase
MNASIGQMSRQVRRADARATCLAFLAGLASSLAPAVERPNILLIVSEDNGPELGCYGDPFVRTPQLDQLAAEGVRFERACVAQAGCSPSRASVLTGLYPHQHGQVGLATWGFRLYRDDTPNLVRSLKDAGYRTGLIGKLHVNPESAFPFDFSRIPSGNFERKNLGDYARYAATFFAAGDGPFFLSVNYPDAHGPWLRQVDGLPADPLDPEDVKPLPSFGVDTPQLRKAIANHYNCMMRLDSLVGDLLAELERAGKADTTLVVYIGDHGADMLRGKRTCYEGGLRIPLIARWPGHARAGQVRTELVSTIDLVPTFLAVAGATPIAGLPGRSLVPLLAGEQPDWRTELFAEFHTHAAASNFYPQRSVRTDRYKLIENLLPGEVNPGVEFTFREFDTAPAAIAAGAAEVRDAYRLMARPPRYELYDLETDPHEFRTLADDPDHRVTRDELAKALAAWRQETADPLLDPTVLARFVAEVRGVTKKKEARVRDWGYPAYFFGQAPAFPKASPTPAGGEAAAEGPRKKKKSMEAAP